MKKTQVPPEIKNKILSWVRDTVLGMAGIAILLGLCAGKWDWLWGWVFLILLTAAMASHVAVLLPTNPALLADRAGGLRQPGAKPWDLWLASLAGSFFFAIMILAGLDERWGWTDALPLGWHIAGILLFVIWWGFFLWAMACNPFFSESVRIQDHHQVAMQGPYRFVRHPGYLGNLIGCLGLPLLFGSWWACIPASLAMAAFLLRTALEDKTLQNELGGYAEYSLRVRYRLIPGIW